MQVKCAPDLPTVPNVLPHIILVFRKKCRDVLESDRQILTTNPKRKTPRESITRRKLAFEVAKLVKRSIMSIKVRATFIFVDLFSKTTRVGRT